MSRLVLVGVGGAVCEGDLVFRTVLSSWVWELFFFFEMPTRFIGLRGGLLWLGVLHFG